MTFFKCFFHHLPDVNFQQRYDQEKGQAEDVLRELTLAQQQLTNTAILQSVLCTHISVFGSATKQGRNQPQRAVRTADKINGASLTSIKGVCTSRIRSRARNICAAEPNATTSRQSISTASFCRRHHEE